MQKKLSRKDIVDLIAAIEQQLSLEDFVYEGVNFWPLIRIRLFMGTVEKSYGAKITSINGGNNFALLKRIFSSKPKARVNESSTETLFVSSQNYKVSIADQDFDRVLEAYVEDCRVQKIPFAVLDNGSGVKVVETTQTADSSVFKIMLIAKVLSKIDSLRPSRSRKVEKMLQTVEGHLLQPPMSDVYYIRKQMLNAILYVRRLISGMKRYLIETRVGAIYFATGYDFLSLAICAAGDSLEIQTNIVQHGGQSANNAVFGRWTKLPAGGFEMLPNTYRCWDQSSSRTINQWASSTRKHRGEVDGHRWNDIVTNHHVLNDNSSSITAVSNQHPINVIVSLQPSAPQLIDTVFKVMNTAPKQIAWWVRVHPRQKATGFAQELIQRVPEGSIVSIDVASTVALPLLLSHMDMHITAYSSTVYDALGFNVPTIFSDAQALEYFSDLLELNNVSYMTDPIQITEFLCKLVEAAEQLREAKNQTND